MGQLWIDCLLAGGKSSAQDRHRLAGLTTRTRRLSAGHTVLFEDDPANALYGVESGWVASTRELEDGCIQILDFFLPGQLVGLRQLTVDNAMVSYQALTNVEVSLVNKDVFHRLMDESSHLNNAVLNAIAMEDAWLMERITTLGQRNAEQCLVHLLLEIADRSALLTGRPRPADTVQVPVSQEQLGEILALTPVHVCRVLKKLREASVLEQDGTRWRFPDRQQAEAFAAFDARRLRLEP